MEEKRKVFKKDMGDINNAICRGSDGIDITFQRLSPREFERLYKSPSHWVCTGCGDFIDESTKEEHDKCQIGKVDEKELAHFLGDFLTDDEKNVIEINDGCDDQCFISLT